MKNTPPSKRKRVEHPELAHSQAYKRGDLWLDDGNVVLIAQNTAFRVHKSVLSRNSEVFRDMFTMPQPTDAETYEGCPVVHLQDSWKALGYILSALFDSGNACVSVFLLMSSGVISSP